MAKTFEILDRTNFAHIIKSYRAARAFRSYARFGSFGRVLITADDVRITLPYWTNQPHFNIHRQVAH